MSIDKLIQYLVVFLGLDIVTTEIGLRQSGIYETNEMMLFVVDSITAMIFIKVLFLIAVLIGVEIVREALNEEYAKIPVVAVLLMHVYVVATNIILIV